MQGVFSVMTTSQIYIIMLAWNDIYLATKSCCRNDECDYPTPPEQAAMIFDKYPQNTKKSGFYKLIIDIVVYMYYDFHKYLHNKKKRD